MKHGFVKVAAAVPFVRVADCEYNVERIEALVLEADAKGVEIITFPELSITGYTCGDLFSALSSTIRLRLHCFALQSVRHIPRCLSS